jgi:SAM-dependent methyltransferase
LTDSRRAAWRFPVTVFLSAFLLFQIQPIVARRLLPEFGGTPAVWSTCLLFFQAVLLAGYIYAHWLRWRWAHAVLLAGSFAFLLMAPGLALEKTHSGGSAGDPSWQILLLLAATVGPPYFLLSSTAPLVQRWFAAAEPEQSPWRLYALSNFGSFLALLSYPFAVEPFVTLARQTQIWTWLYGAFVVLCGWTALTAPTALSVSPTQDALRDAADRPSAVRILFWLALAACGSTILLATTNEISQEIAVNPFLWVAPLSLYLLTFVLTFESDRWYKPAGYAGLAGLFTAIACAVSSAGNAIPVLPQLAVYLAALFLACMLCHGELVRSRPSPRYLTQFYLTVAAGGALGGVFVALIAPRVFTEFSEYPIGLGAACLLGLASWVRREGFKAWKGFDVRVPLSALMLGLFTAVADAWVTGGQGSLASARNFYGILRVTEAASQNGPKRSLTHGRIDHGFQYQQPERRDWPTSYYGSHSGVAMALSALASPRRIAVVGLGTGTLAAWGRPGDAIRFYEINPDVVGIANTWFSFLKDSKARVEIVEGDARIQLAKELDSGAAGEFDAIVVDAFSSDAIPLHLLTTECADIYRRHLKPGGILLLHITNRTLDLAPVAKGVAEHLGWPAFQIISEANPETGENASQWVLIAADPSAFLAGGDWKLLKRTPLTWTDDFASLWHVLKL